MNFSLLGWHIEITKEVIAPPEEEHYFDDLLKGVSLPKEVDLFGEVIPGYETFEAELQSEDDSVEEREWREEQNWLNKRKQKNGPI